MTKPGPVGRRLAADDDVPAYLRELVARVDGAPLPARVRHATGGAPDGSPRSAVLILVANSDGIPDVLLTARATTLRSHAGQPAFPGGRIEADEDAVTAAIREGNEETGLDPSSVQPLALLPQMFLRPSGFVVDPVLAHWRMPGPVSVMDPAETSAVVRVPVSDLTDPVNRGSVSFRGFTTPAFSVAGLVVWGFTAGLLDVMLDWAGWSEPWERGREIRLDDDSVRLANQGVVVADRIEPTGPVSR
jgi:8-oxo-dGTP pyrophosphatase MutT (NUDIX family)